MELLEVHEVMDTGEEQPLAAAQATDDGLNAALARPPTRLAPHGHEPPHLDATVRGDDVGSARFEVVQP